jgi:hypothetical protein
MRISVPGVILGTWALGLTAGSAFAQYVISAHAGVVQYVEGIAYLNDQVVDPKFGQFPDIKENQEFRTAEGRAEVLLSPGVFLRLGEKSSIKMLSTHLTDVRVEVLTGSAVIECDDVPKDNSIEAVYKGSAVHFEKQGLYRIDTEPARLRVYEGEAVVHDATGQLTVKGGKQTNLDAVLQAESFDRKDTDSLYNWSDRRAAYVAKANYVSASTASTPYSYGGFGGYSSYAGYDPSFLGGWMFNPVFGMYTFMPYSGFGYSPFGYTFYSPYTVAYAPYFGTGGGYTPVGGSGSSRVSGITGGSRMTGSPSVGRGSFAAGGRSSGSISGPVSGGGAHMSSGSGHSGGGHR